MTQDRFFSQEGNLAATHLESMRSPSCDKAPVAGSAISAAEDLSEKEWAELAEHVQSCSACAAILTQYQEMKDIISSLTQQKLYANEPDIQLSAEIQHQLEVMEMEVYTQDKMKGENKIRTDKVRISCWKHMHENWLSLKYVLAFKYVKHITQIINRHLQN